MHWADQRNCPAGKKPKLCGQRVVLMLIRCLQHHKLSDSLNGEMPYPFGFLPGEIGGSLDALECGQEDSLQLGRQRTVRERHSPLEMRLSWERFGDGVERTPWGSPGGGLESIPVY